MRRSGGTIYDALRQEAMHNGAFKQPAPWSELEVQHSTGGLGTMDTSGIGHAWTTSRSSRTFTGGGLTPMMFFKTPGGPNTEEQLQAAAVSVNARAAYPSRGVEPRSPLAGRR